MEMKIPGAQKKSNSWRLNEELIQGKEEEEKINEELDQYFKINDTKEITEVTLWEAHKAYIRAILIEIGSRKKMERKKNMEVLIKEIHVLEQRH